MATNSSANTRKLSWWVGSWYFLATVLSFGLLAWLPFAHAARRLRRRSLVILALAYGIASVVLFVLLTLTPTDTEPETSAGDAVAVAAGLLMPLTIIAGCIQQALLRREVFAAPVRSAEPALAAALAARERRTAARQIVANDPLLARDLHIGRPDLPHTYDDGGLVDINNAPAAAIAQACGISEQVAQTIVTARSASGGFLNVEDVFSMAEVPVGSWEIVRDRAFVSPMLI